MEYSSENSNLNLFNFETFFSNLINFNENLSNNKNLIKTGQEEEEVGPNKYFLETLDSRECSFVEEEGMRVDDSRCNQGYQLFPNIPLGEVEQINNNYERLCDGENERVYQVFGQDPIGEIRQVGGVEKINVSELLNESVHHSQSIQAPIGKKQREKKTKKLKCLHWNANGIVGRTEEIGNLIQEFDPDIVSISETKTNETTENYIFIWASYGYLPMVRSRPGESEGGGSAILFKDKLRAKPIVLDEKFSDLEIVGGEINLGASVLSVFSWYVRPQERVRADLLRYIESLGDFIILGDLNAKINTLNEHTNPSGRLLEAELQCMNIRVMNSPNLPTYVRENDHGRFYKSIIDLVVASESMAQKMINFETHEISPVYDAELKYFHIPLSCEFEVELRPKKERISYHKPFLYDKAKWEELIAQTERELYDDISDQSSEDQSERITKSLVEAAEKFIPRAKEKMHREENFPAPIKEVLNSRNYWGKRFRARRDKFSADNYIEMEKLANAMIRDYRQEQWKKFLEKQGKSPLSSAPFWKRINRLRSSKRKRKIETIIINGSKVEKDEDKAELFAKNLENKFKPENNSRFNENKKKEVEEFFTEPLRDKFSAGQRVVKEFNFQELDLAIKKMNNKTSIDPMGLSNKILKKAGPVLKERLLNLFNACLREQKVPSSWKHSVITMLLKPGQDTSLLNSYRPISMTPCIARLYERLVLARLQKHLKDNKILIMNQSGFRKERQTKDNILVLIQRAQEGFNRDEKSLAVFFDVAAAFDKVWHEGLFFKLYELGVPFYILTVIMDFLTDRTFVVKCGGAISSIKIIMCGVPQGGVLSPTLFSVYINNVPIASNANEETLLFADDIVYMLRYRYKKNNKIDPEVGSKAKVIAQEYMNKLENWMNDWRLTLAPQKCAQITFSKARDMNADSLDITLYGENIPRDPNPKFLGIVFDPRLKFDAHVEKVKTKIIERLSLLKILSYDKNWRLNTEILVNFYKVLVRSVLDYACVTAAVLTKETREEFEKIQNNALRIIFKKRLTDHTRIETLLEWAKISSIEERHRNLINRYYEKCLTSNNPLIKKLFNDYKTFKYRDFWEESWACREGGEVDAQFLVYIREHNIKNVLGDEKYPTTLCKADPIIRELILDSYAISSSSSGAVT
jgi:exonuclease III